MYPARNKLLVTIVLILTSFLSFFLLLRILGPIPLTITSLKTTNADLFTVNGVGEEKAVGEETSVSLGVTQIAATTSDAQNEVNKVIKKILSETKALGIPDKNIRTENISTSPNFDFSNGEQKITGYEATQNLVIKTPSTDLANKIIDLATTNGANILQGASFDLTNADREKLETKARQKAIAAAKKKAKEISGETGIKLGRIVNIQVENNNENNIIMPQRFAATKEKDMVETDLQPGENTVKVTVTLFYETL